MGPASMGATMGLGVISMPVEFECGLVESLL